MLHERARMVETLVGADTVMVFANVVGPGHMDQDTFLGAVRCYTTQKELLADYARKKFVPAGPVDYNVVAADTEDRPPPSPAGQGPSA